MDWIIPVIIILIFSSIFSDKKKKKRQQKAAAQQQPRAAKPVNFQDMNAVPWAAAKPSDLPKAAPVRSAAPKAAPVKTAAPKTGSMDFKGLEGEAESEHAAHKKRVLNAERLQREAAEAAADAYEVNLEQLRSAVIMSEILNKPVSLRKNGYRGY